MKALRQFLDTIPAMPQVEHVAGIYRWTAEQYLALIKLHNTFHEAGPDRTPDTVEYWKSRATTAELKVLTFHEEIAKLPNGPDRTTQRVTEEYEIDGTRYRIFGFDAEAGAARMTPRRDRDAAMNFFAQWRQRPEILARWDADILLEFDCALVAEAMVAFAEAGPDRGQQGAPDIEELVRKYESSAMYCKADHAAQTKAESRINIRAALKEFGAKATREGQAPTS